MSVLRAGRLPRFLGALCVSVFCIHPARAAAAPTNASGVQLTIEVRDGSRLVGKSVEDTLGVHSATLGGLKLPWSGIRSIEQADTNTGMARLTATNGDAITIQITTPSLRIETCFGKAELPVNLIRSVRVSVSGKAGQLPPGLVALWPGEDNGNDSAGGNNGVLNDVGFAPGKVARAFSLNGTSSNIKIPANPSLDVGAGDGFTLMAWIKPSSLASRGEIFEWSTGQAGQPQPWGVHLLILSGGESPGAFVGNVHGTDGQEHLIASPPGTLAANIFQHVALTYDKTSGTASLFCNGTIVAGQNIGRFTPQTSYDLYLGRRPAGDSMNSFSGLIDEAAIFNRALSAEEIQAVCAEQNNGEPPPPPPTAPPSGPSRAHFEW
jgi:hypothetical protein